MGNGASQDQTRRIYLDINGKKENIAFSRYTSAQDIHDLICQIAECSRSAKVSVSDETGANLLLAPNIPANNPRSPYKVIIKEPPKPNDTDLNLVKTVLNEISSQFTRAFKVEEVRRELQNRINELEKKLTGSEQHAVELDKCKIEIAQLKDRMLTGTAVPSGTVATLDNRYRFKSVEYAQDKPVIKVSKTLPGFEKYVLSEETKKYLQHPTFDIWSWESNEMLSLLEHMYYELGIIEEWKINTITLKTFLLTAQANYRNNPFHNFRHCFCVAQMMYGIIHECGLKALMTKEDLGVMITACICHDLDHPGYNNTYQINARTQLAVRYNDISPLENHHCSVAFQIFSQPECNIFANLPRESFRRVRAGIIMLVLATDMARHAEIMESFKMKVENFDFKQKDHMDTLKMVLIKCCDISNEVRPLNVSEPWLDCLLEEYFNQSDKEKAQGLPVAPFMDRDKVTKPGAQIGFIKFVLLPLFESVAKLFKELEPLLVQQLKDSLLKYETMKAEMELSRTLKTEEKKLRQQMSSDSGGPSKANPPAGAGGDKPTPNGVAGKK